MAEIRPHIKSAVDDIKDQCDSILEHAGMLAYFPGRGMLHKGLHLKLTKSCTK